MLYMPSLELVTDAVTVYADHTDRGILDIRIVFPRDVDDLRRVPGAGVEVERRNGMQPAASDEGVGPVRRRSDKGNLDGPVG